MNEKPFWTGIAPSPAVLGLFDYEEMTVLAFLSWCTVANQPVTFAEVAALKDRDGKELGASEAREIVDRFMSLKVMSVFGLNGPRNLSVRLGGFRPRMPSIVRPNGAPVQAARPVSVVAKMNRPWIAQLKEQRVETGLKGTGRTPAYVYAKAAKLRERQALVEGGSFTGTLTEAALARLAILRDRISLYERWLKDEPRHARLAVALEKKRKAVPEMEFQVERAKVKQEELESGEADA